MAFDARADARVRTAAFEWLTARVEELGDVLPRTALAEGFELGGVRVPLLGPQGIFKPKVMELPLSITTSPNSPYDDRVHGEDLIRYRYRGQDPLHHDNVGLRTVMNRGLPLIYFHGVVPGKYVPAWPVFVVDDEPSLLTFSVAVDDARHLGLGLDEPAAVHAPEADGRRRYVTAVVRRRLHQSAFRERVLAAYRSQCALCRFRHQELLDAAHIIPDSAEGGEPRVENGLALCTLHHAAFDRGFLGIRPDYIVEIRPDLLTEKDGPTLVHSIQSFHGTTIHLPRAKAHRPSPERLDVRYRDFLTRARAS